MLPAIQDQCHEFLLRLAGRLPDRYLWRFRDWLAEGAAIALGEMLPLTLLRERVDLDGRELVLLRELSESLAAGAFDPAMLIAVGGVDTLPASPYTFTGQEPADLPLGDSVPVVLSAVLRGRPGTGALYTAWRSRPDDTSAKRVLLVEASEGKAVLTGELQRVVRALGEPAPAVEVFQRGANLPQYHRDALAVARSATAAALPATTRELAYA